MRSKTYIEEYKKSVYAVCIDSGFELDHRGADLFIKDCTAARTLLHQRGQVYDNFTDSSGVVWLEVAFAYSPYWGRVRNVTVNNNHCNA